MGGYPLHWRIEVVKSASVGYTKIWKSEVNGTGFVNRPGHVTATKRRAMRLEGNSHWFKQKSAKVKKKPTKSTSKATISKLAN